MKKLGDGSMYGKPPMFSNSPSNVIRTIGSPFLSINRLLHNSTIFPYTTLFRSPPCLEQAVCQTIVIGEQAGIFVPERNDDCRSEEHTSELQSRRDLVCRLLLEKKKIEMIQRDSANILDVMLVSINATTASISTC